METGLTANFSVENKGFRIKSLTILLLICCTFTLNLFGEGTRELLVNTTVVGSGLQFDTTKSFYTGTAPTTPANVVQIWDQGPSPGGLGRATGTYTSIKPANEKFRIKIRVCNVGEVINFGFNPSNNQLTFWRLYKEDGTPIRFNGAGGALTNLSAIAGVETVSAAIAGSGSLGPNDFTYRVPRNTEAAQPGYINWYSQAAVGPLPTCSTTVAVGQLGVGYPVRTYCGYNAIQYQVQPGDIGAKGYADFFIVFNGNDPVNEQKTVNRHLAMFDVTVWSDNTTLPRNVKKARLYSSAWDINCNGLSNPQQTFNSKLFFYSKDSVITSVTFNQMRPYGFIICANQTGCANTGNNANDRKSRIQFNGAPDYPVFLNNPYPATVADRTCGIVPKTSFGNVLGASITGCDNDRCINLLVDKTGTVGITLIPPAPSTAFVPRIFNNSTVVANTNTCIPWDGLDGAGNPIIGPVTVQINYFNGLTNLPLYDVEEHQFGYVIDLIAPPPSVGAKPILIYWDDRPPAGSAVLDINAGSSRDGLWDSDNNPLTADIVVGYHDGDPVNAFQSHSTYNLLGCDPTVDHSAGTAGQQGCHLWSGRGSNGACPGNPNCAETHNTWWNANVVEITVPFTPSNVHVYSDIDAAPAPVGTGNASAKVKNFCVPTPVPISGIVKVDPATTGIADANDLSDDINGTGSWSIITGSGSFGSPVTNLVNTYVPDAGGLDLARGFVILKVTSDITAATPCGSGNDTLRINLYTGPDVWARPGPITVCANNALVQLDPGIVGDSSGKNAIVSTFRWTPYVGGVAQVGGTFVPNNQSLGTNVTYTPPASFTSGTIVMRLKSINLTTPSNVTCAADSAQFNIIVNSVPTVVALDTLKICNTGAGTTVPVPVGQATINGGSSLVGFTVNWTGNGSFSGNGTLTPIYTPTAAERTAGLAKIVFNVTKTSAPSCGVVRDTLIIKFTTPPTANAGSPFSLCRNNATTISLKGVATNFGSVSWTAAPATGSFSPTNNDTTTFTPSGALPASYTFTLRANPVAGSTCAAVTSQVVVSFTASPIVDAGADKNYCAESPTVQLAASLGGSATTGEWWGNTAGTVKPLGTFTPNDKDPNATYTLSAVETTLPAIGLYFKSTGNGNCLAVVDSMAIFPTPNPAITLRDTVLCDNVTTLTLNKTYIVGGVAAGTILWTSLGSAQNFAPANTESTVFTPTAADIGVGSVKLVLQAVSSANATCAPVKDTMTVTFSSAPTVNAGADHNVCSNNPTVAIAGTVSAGAGHNWTYVSGPTGSIAAAGNLNTTFTATGTPAVPSTTILRLTATLAGCNPVSDDVNIIYTAPPSATITTLAGNVCANNSLITLKGGTSTGVGTWVSSSGCNSCFSDANRVGLLPAVDSTVYTPSATDKTNGSVTFTLQTGNNGNCNTVNSSSVTITINPSPTVSITPITAVCENNAAMTLAASSSTGAGTWSSSSGCVGCFVLNGPNNLTGTYNPSVNDITNGTVTFTFTSANNGNCVAVPTSTIATINPAPAIIAGPDLTVCSNQNTVALTGATSTNTSSVAWTVKAGAGTGSITNPSSLTTAVYNITATDKANGTAIVVLTGNGSAGCSPVTDERIIIFTNESTASVGPDQIICQNDATPALLQAAGTAGGTWTCAGCISGIVNAGSLTANYTPAPGDINQTRTFTYTAPGGPGCPSASDALTIHFNPAPVVTITAPASQCGNSMVIALSGTVSNATGVIWTSNGTGSFSNQTSTATNYTFSAADTVGTNSTVTFTLTSTGSSPCSPVAQTATVTITDPIVLFSGADQNKCGTAGTVVNLAPVVLSGGATSVTWTITSASTGVLAATGATTASYTVGAGDAGTTITFQGTTNGVAPCLAQTDQVSYTFIAPVTSTITAPPAGFCQTGSVVLSGTITNANTGTWACTNCTGTGTFSPDNTYNNLIPQTSVTFTPSPSDTAAASLSFRLTSDNINLCGAVASTVVSVNLEKKPRVNAGPDIIRCANNNVVTLPTTGVTHTNAGVWHAGVNKTTGFAPSNAFPAATSYDPDTTEVQNGFVTLTLISTGSTFCPSDSDKVIVTFTQSPVANAGLDRTICKNNPVINLVGTVNPATGFTTSWSSPNCGAACFSSPSALSTNYTLSFPADTIGSTLNLFLTATDPTGLCAPDRDTVVINLSQPPRVDLTTTFPNPICNDSLFVNLTGTSTGGFNWTSTGTGTFQANAFQPAVVYPFTAADRAKANLAPPNNKIRIYLSSDNGFCLPVKDSVDITIAPAPVVTITTGDSTTICANTNTLNLVGSVNQAGFNIDWTSSGTGTFSPDAPTTPAFNTVYTFTPLDKAAGSIILVAHTTNPVGSTCKSASKQYKVNITPLPIVNAGTDYVVCQTTTSLDLSDASVSNVNSAVWSTSGNGVFGISNTTIGAGSVYYPTYLLPAGTNDVDKPSITLTLTAMGCDTLTDTRLITFTPKPTASAGVDQTLCNEAVSASITGVATNASSVNWRVAGSATTFSSASAAVYNLTGANKAAGFVDLVFTANGNGSCSPVTDTVRIIIRPQPTLNIGPDASFCSKTIAEILQYNFPAITLTNSGITPAVSWSTTGTAANLDAFNPLQPAYTIANSDITNGSVTIIATTRSHPSCMAVSDAMVINITKAPTLNIGPDINACALSGNTIQLGSSSTNSSGTPSWASDKSGVFDNPNSVTPIYDPSAAEEATGNQTTIIAIINGTGSCPAAADTLIINFNAVPTLADLSDTVICFTNGVPFNYPVSSGLLGDWTTTMGAFLAPGGIGQQSVVLQATPVAAGTITITFDPADACYLAQTVDATLTLVEAPTVTATSPLDVCVNNFAAAINLSSAPANQGSLSWSIIQGFGSFSATNTANTTYTLKSDSSDFALDSILVKITANATNPSCPAAVDTVAIRTHQAPTLLVANQLVCSDLLNDPLAITLNGNTNGSGFTGTTWSSAQLSAITSPTSLITTATLSAFPATVTLTANGLHASCTPVSTNLTITAQTAPTFATPGNDFNACSNGSIVDLNNAAINPSVPGGMWSSLTGGSFTPNNIGASGISYTPSAGDIVTGNFDLIYTITDTGVCYKGYADTVNIVLNKPITVSSLNPIGTFCAQSNSVPISATTSSTPLPGGSTTTWSTPNGLGAFAATNVLSTSYDPNPSNVPNGGDVANGGAVLMIKLDLPVAYGCPDDSDFVSLLLVPEPAAIVNAGATQQICVDRVSAQLQGLILNADGGVWRTTKYGNISDPLVAATGSLSDSTDLEADYFLSAADRLKTGIRLYLYSVGGNALCSQVIDSVDITFTPRPVPSATASAASVCADVDSINLTGAFTLGGINGIWTSSGDGVFTNLGIFDPTPIYIPGPTDIALGSVIFTYSSNNFQDCQSYSAKDTTIITPKIEADAGPDLTVCGNNTTGITITASSPPTNTGIWTPLGVAGTDFDGTFSQTGLQLTYIPGDTIDPVVAAVGFKFVSTGGSPCKPDSSQMVLKIAPAPTVAIATNTQTVCNDVSSINVNVTNITIASKGFWTTTGTGNFDDANALSTRYNFSASDKDSTNITIAFVTTDNTSSGSTCNPAADAMVITLKPKPVVTALPQYNCVTPIGVTLDNSSVTYVDPGASGIWTTNSVGTPGQFSLDQFISSPASNAASYFPSASDITRGSVILTLTSVGAGTCGPVSRSVSLNVSTTPIADAGPDLFVCAGSNVTLHANAQTNLIGYDWTNLSNLSTASGLDTIGGPINLPGPVLFELTVTDNRGCSNKDTVAVNPVANPSITQVAEQCYDFFGYVKLTVTNPPISPLGGFQWSYSSDGVSTPVLMNGETKDSVRVTQPGVYQVTYSLGACSQPSLGATKVLDLPRFLTPDYIGCKNSTVTATVNEIPNAQLSAVVPAIKPYVYDWTPASASTNNVATLPTSIVNPTIVDTIKYGVTASYTTSPFGLTCTYTDTVRVISIPRPDPFLIDSIQVCAGEIVTLDANTPPSNLPSLSQFTQIIEWYEITTPATILDNDAIYNPTVSNDYGVRVTIGQCVDGDTSRVDFRPYPVNNLPSEVKQCFEQIGSYTLDAGTGGGTIGSNGLTGVTYQWFSAAGDPALNTSNSQTTVITYPMLKDQEDEQILASVIMTNQYNALSCIDTNSTLVRDVCVPRVFPPTVFHPGDGNPIDAEFTIKSKYINPDKFRITVYSRWGEVIFVTEDINKSWDGTYRGELMPVGVYAYIITYEGKDVTNKGPFKKEGRIVLVR